MARGPGRGRTPGIPVGSGVAGRGGGNIGEISFFSSKPGLAFSRCVSGVKQSVVEERTFIFPTTHWTTLLQPINQRTEQAQTALNKLFETYRQPIIEFVRTMVRHPQHAEDIAQDFIARMLTREDLVNTDRGKGRFRAYLSTSIRRYVISHYAAQDTQKRKELNNASSLDEMAVEPGHANDAEKEFTRRWWRATIDEAVRRLRLEWEVAGKGGLFGDLEPLLWDRKDGLSLHDIAARHQLTANAVSLRKMRLQERFREILVAVIAETVGSPGEVQEEIRHLLQDP